MSGLPLLGGYAAKQCPRRVHNDHDRTVPTVEHVVAEELQARFDAGIAFERKVFAAVQDALGDACVLVQDSGTTRGRVDATMEALRRGVPVVLGGQLPHDVQGGRGGKPDVLVRREGGYLPADVKHHRLTKVARTKSARISTLSRPADEHAVEGLAPELSTRFDDYVQLAHYTRMLQAAGVHAGQHLLTGAVIGSDDLSAIHPSGHALVWLALDEPLFETFSRSEGRRKRSALERYDHEHAFRLKVAQVARARTGAPDDPAPLVVPIWQPECTSCKWAPVCREEIGEDAAAPSFKTGQLDVREWLALRDFGVESLASLATLDTSDSDFLASYLQQVTHQRRPIERLQAAVERAGLLRDGITIKRTSSGPLQVPRPTSRSTLTSSGTPTRRSTSGASGSGPATSTTTRTSLGGRSLTKPLNASSRTPWCRGSVTSCKQPATPGNPCGSSTTHPQRRPTSSASSARRTSPTS